ncbi:ribosome assembly factor SBDS [Candidatus Parvarchaeota archaeon]|nr:ribosome assembly factor SBDS [Candidatus Parvarchaeota archaeon]
MEDRVIARLQIKDKRYEIFVDCEKAVEIKEGRIGDVESALLVSKIFKDAKRGEVAGNLEKEFGTDDVYKIALDIIKRGEIQISASFRQKQAEMIRNEVLDDIASMAIDVTTGLPIPRKRIELALEQIKFNFDPKKPKKILEEDLTSKLKTVLPLKLGEFEYSIDVPLQYSDAIMLHLKRLASIKTSNRTDRGLTITFSVKAGNENELMNRLKSSAHGNLTIRKI